VPHGVDAHTGNWRVNCNWRTWKCRTFKIPLREIAGHKIARHENAGHVLWSQKCALLNICRFRASFVFCVFMFYNFISCNFMFFSTLHQLSSEYKSLDLSIAFSEWDVDEQTDLLSVYLLSLSSLVLSLRLFQPFPFPTTDRRLLSLITRPLMQDTQTDRHTCLSVAPTSFFFRPFWVFFFLR